MSNPLVKIRYALLLPLLHLAIAGSPLFHQESQVRGHTPLVQRFEDLEKEYPTSPSEGMPIEPCFEYRPSSATRTILAADLPVAILVGASGEYCDWGAIRLIPNRLLHRLQVKTRVILVECLIVLGIFAQWWLVGFWIDQRRRQSRPMRRWIIPVAIITAGGIAMAPTAFGQQGVVEYVNIYSAMITFLAWIVLLLMFAATGARWVIGRIRQSDQGVKY